MMTLFDIGKWSLTGALGAGCSWAFGILLGRTFLSYDISEGTPVSVLLTLYSGAWGLFVGAVAAALLLRPIRVAVAYWGFVLGVAAAFGIVMTEIAIASFAGWLPNQASSSLGFAAGGLFAGLCGYVWFQWIGERRTVEPELVEEYVGQPFGEGAGSAPTRPTNTPRFASFVQSMPILVAAGCSLVVGVRVSSSDITLGLFVGLFGLSVTLSLWDHEQRLRSLERRSQGNAK